jgi:anti-sigma regulatory factor (Ser/Thr protein kinase)
MATDTGVGTRGQSVERLGGEGLRMRLGNGPEAAADARRAISKLRADLDPPLMETLRLLVTELITNCVRHTASDSLTLRVAVGKSAVLTEVADSGPGFDEECVERSASDDTGWGLFLLHRLASKWGVAHDGPSTRVWFELKRA